MGLSSNPSFKSCKQYLSLCPYTLPFSVVLFLSFCFSIFLPLQLKIMARGSAAKTTKMLMLREAMRVDRGFSKHAGGADGHKKPASSINCGDNISYSPCWVPHPRTGIYCPKGQEWVMDDLPEQAASLNRTHWLRNVDGVDKADHNTPSDLYLHIGV